MLTLPVRVVWLSLVLAAWTGAAQPPQPVFEDRFDSPQPSPQWAVHVSTGNTVTVEHGALEIRAAENTFAHLTRPLQGDLVRASCVLKAGSGVSWCTSLFLYWSRTDWCQIGVIPRGDGRFYTCVTTGGKREEHDLSRCDFSKPQHVAIELGEDCIRFQTSADGVAWRTELLLDRPTAFAGQPTRLIVGKGYADSPGPGDLDTDYGERGQIAVSTIDDVRVEPTPTNHRRMTAEEKRLRESADRDPHGAAILARDADPDFDTVAAVFPPMSRPREALGVKDHPYEIGIDFDGTIQIAEDGDGWHNVTRTSKQGTCTWFEVGAPPSPLVGSGAHKHLLDGHLPVVEVTYKHDGLLLKQTTFAHSAGMSPDSPTTAYTRLVVYNPDLAPRSVDIALHLRSGETNAPPLTTSLTVPSHSSRTANFTIPVPARNKTAALIEASEFEQRLAEVRQFWEGQFATGMQITVPEKRVNDAWRAWTAYSYINTDKKDGKFEIHDGAGFYEEVFGYSGALACIALDQWGRHADAARYIDSMLAMRRPDGVFFVNYGLPDHGALILAIVEHYRLTGDADYLRSKAADIESMCDWIATTRAAQPKDAPAIVRGLIRYTPYCDYATPTVDYYGDAYSCTALEHASKALAEIGHDKTAKAIAAEAADYRAAILASMDAAVVERDGVKLLPMEPDTQRLLKSTNYKGGGYYGLVASMFLETEFLPPADPRARLVTSALETRNGLILGMCEFEGSVDHAYTYGYWLNCLRRNDVKRVLLGFYGSLAYGMGRDTFCPVEVTHLVTGDPTATTPHTYSNTQQLRLLRDMLVQEEGDDLVLARAVPGHWLAPGQRIEVTNAPTSFGDISYTIQAPGDGKTLAVEIAPPTRHPPRAIRLVLRDPAHRPIRTAGFDGKDLRPSGDSVLILTPTKGPMRIEVRY